MFLHVATSANGEKPGNVSDIIQEVVSIHVLLSNLEILWSWLDMSFLKESVKALKSQRSINVTIIENNVVHIIKDGLQRLLLYDREVFLTR